MNHLLKNFFMLMILIIGAGCSKSEPPPTPPTPVPVAPPVSPPPPSTNPPSTNPPTTTPPTTTPPNTTPPTTTPPNITARLVPIKIESPDLTITLKYEGNTALLFSIEESKTATKGMLSYKENVLVKYVHSARNEKVYTADYWKRTNLVIDDVTRYDPKNTPLGNYTLQYDAQKQITSIKTYSARNLLLSTKILSYDAAGNMNNSVVTAGPEEKSTFTFDHKNGIFKHVDNTQLISFEFQHKLLSSITNNVLSRSGIPAVNDYSCTYEYQSEDYPSKVTVTEAGVKTVYLITYKIL